MAFPENTVNDTGIKHIWDKVTAALSGKVDKVSGKGLSTNDYTTTEKDKLAGIESGAQVNTVTSVAGKTGAVTLDKSDVGLGNVDNTSDANKPISTATQNALDDKADASDVTEVDTSNTVPFLYRETPYEADRVFLDALVGGSVAWNQLLVSEHKQHSYNPTSDQSIYDITVATGLNIPIIQGHKYLLSAKMTRTISGNNLIGLILWSEIATSQAMIVWNNGDANGYKQAIFLPYSGQTSFQKISFNNYSGKAGFAAGDTMEYDDFNVIDLTQMFGTTIADYIYSLEQATEGSGIAWLKSHGFFTKDYYPYNAGELISVKTSGKKYVGFNQWDEEWELGDYNDSGQAQSVDWCIRSKQDDYIPVLGNTVYYAKSPEAIYPCFYDINKTFISKTQVIANTTFTTPANARYMRFVIHSNYGTTYNHDICINISKTEGTPKNGDYVPYEEKTYDISNIDLRGIPKLVNNELVYDGDIYESDGDVTRKYGIVDLGSLTWAYQTFSNGSRFASSSLRNLIKKPTSASEYASGMISSRFYANGDPINNVGTTLDKLIAKYVDGDIYIIDKSYSDAATFKTAMSGVYLIYELATPTTEITDPFTNPQICDKDGTEEWIDDRTVPIPVGHNSTYANLPSMMDGRYLNYMVDNFATKEYTDRAVERVAPKATLIDTWMISEESDTISVDLTSYDCNFFLLEYLFNLKRGTTLIPRPQGGSFSASVVTYNNGSALYIELTYNPTTKELAYTSNITSQFGILAIYTI